MTGVGAVEADTSAVEVTVKAAVDTAMEAVVEAALKAVVEATVEAAGVKLESSWADSTAAEEKGGVLETAVVEKEALHHKEVARNVDSLLQTLYPR